LCRLFFEDRAAIPYLLFKNYAFVVKKPPLFLEKMIKVGLARSGPHDKNSYEHVIHRTIHIFGRFLAFGVRVCSRLCNSLAQIDELLPGFCELRPVTEQKRRFPAQDGRCRSNDD